MCGNGATHAERTRERGVGGGRRAKEELLHEERIAFRRVPDPRAHRLVMPWVDHLVAQAAGLSVVTPPVKTNRALPLRRT